MGCIETRSRSISNRSQFSPANEIKSSAALIRCLSTNEDIEFDSSAEERVKKSLQSIIVHASGNKFNETVYLDVKDAVDTLFTNYPESIPHLEHLSSAALKNLKPFESTPAPDNHLEIKSETSRPTQMKKSFPSNKSHSSSKLLASASGPPKAVPTTTTSKAMHPIHATLDMADDDNDDNEGYGFVDLTEH